MTTIDNITISFDNIETAIDNTKKVLYVIRIEKADGMFLFYVGKTGSSNNSGTSSPMARLFNHYASKGNTYGIFKQIFSTVEMNESESFSRIRDIGIIKAIKYYYTSFSGTQDDKYYSDAEKKLISMFKDEVILNESKRSDMSDFIDNQSILKELYKAATGQEYTIM